MENSMNTIEIELRYEIMDCTQLATLDLFGYWTNWGSPVVWLAEKVSGFRRALFLKPLQKLHSKHDVDIYYDNKDALLYQLGIFIRNRNNKKLDIKFNRACLDTPTLALQDYCEEHSFTLPLQEHDLIRLNELLISLKLQPSQTAHFDTMLQANNFVEHYKVDKLRTSYACNAFTIAVDEVADLGTFLEIELMAQTTENLATVKQEMLLCLAGLTLRPLKTGYGTLLLRKKDFNHYLLGRFVLPEDKQYQQP